jgi:malate dehydrogenase (decarboxylating)
MSRYKQEYLMFNDDIQGTAATVLAGLYGAMKVQGLGPEAIKDQVSIWLGF